ncbi:MAG TPA: hypothetical protein VI795_02365 [Patescibacteria group bacterium]|nr:hypothetical protein [Patescibacteria group bacterium]
MVKENATKEEVQKEIDYAMSMAQLCKEGGNYEGEQKWNATIEELKLLINK